MALRCTRRMRSRFDSIAFQASLKEAIPSTNENRSHRWNKGPWFRAASMCRCTGDSSARGSLASSLCWGRVKSRVPIWSIETLAKWLGPFHRGTVKCSCLRFSFGQREHLCLSWARRRRDRPYRWTCRLCHPLPSDQVLEPFLLCQPTQKCHSAHLSWLPPGLVEDAHSPPHLNHFQQINCPPIGERD